MEDFAKFLLKIECRAVKSMYSRTSRNGHLSKVQFSYIFDLSIAVTSLQQPLLHYSMGGCFREVALYLYLFL